MKIIEPTTSEEFKKYYNLRYEILRKPWGQPQGSEIDDGDETSGINFESHTVYLPVFSPRFGIQFEIMVIPSLDVVIRGEYVLASINLDNRWTYTDEDDVSNSLPANWDLNEGPEPEIKTSQYSNLCS